MKLENRTSSLFVVSVFFNVTFIVILMVMIMRWTTLNHAAEYLVHEPSSTNPLVLSASENWGGYYGNPQYDARLTTFIIDEHACDVDVVFLGDSITCFGEWNEWFEDLKVLNRGIGSDTSEGVFYRLDEVLCRNPKKIFLMIGINDISVGVKAGTIIENIQKICDSIHLRNRSCVLYLESILPCSKYDLGLIDWINSELELIADGNACTEYIDLYSEFIQDGEVKEEYYSTDRVHINGSGYKVWYNMISPYVYMQ